MDNEQRIWNRRRSILYKNIQKMRSGRLHHLTHLAPRTSAVVHLMSALKWPYLLSLADMKVVVARFCFMEYGPVAADRILLDRPFVRIRMDGRYHDLRLIDLLDHHGLGFPYVDVDRPLIARDEYGEYPIELIEAMVMNVKMKAQFGVEIVSFADDRWKPDLPDDDGPAYDAAMEILLQQQERRDAAIDAALLHLEERYVERFGRDQEALTASSEKDGP